jgi:hypothetical protein
MNGPIRQVWRFLCGRARRRLGELAADQRGTVSVATVFTLLLLAMLLGLVINSGLQVDQKIRLQNAADAATYSGGVMLARGMNTLAFTNHLLADVFALTAFMREARDRHAEPMIPEILAAWQHVARVFVGSGIPKFDALGPAIENKIPLEQELVRSFSDWAAAASELMLPTLEMILAERRIPLFQRAVVVAYPQLAQRVADEIAQRHGLGSSQAATPRTYRAVMWQTRVEVVGGPVEALPQTRTLPVIDPVGDDVPGREEYLERAVLQRRWLAHTYLAHWNNESLAVFDRAGKMSQFANLWRGFTCGQLEALLDEYPEDNVPHLIRTEVSQITDTTEHLDRDFAFVGVVYSPVIQEQLPGLYANPLDVDQQAMAQVLLFIPTARLVWRVPGSQRRQLPGGVPGDMIALLDEEEDPDPDDRPRVVRQNRPTHWDLLNQNWTVQLVPAQTPRLREIVQAVPNVPWLDGVPLRLPRLDQVSNEDFVRLNNH